jgi:MFS family permease
MAGSDPRAIIENGAMGWRQWAAVALTVGLNALDGFDVLSSAFAGPGIKQEWHLAPDGLGAVLSMELIGMGVGSLLFGGMADKYGRRPTILGCLLLMAIGMFAATTSTSPQTLSIYRVITGLGIGGMLSATNAVVFEVSSRKHRSFALALMVIGYPLGAFGGGLIAASLLETHGWRSVFMFGGIMTTLFVPLVLIFVPETPAWLAQARPTNALTKINHTLRRFGHQALDALGPQAKHEQDASLADIFRPAYRRATLVLSLGYAAHALTFYYILKMAPSIISDPQFAGQSFTKSQGASVLAYANLGGALGGACFGWFMHRFGNHGGAGAVGCHGRPVRDGRDFDFRLDAVGYADRVCKQCRDRRLLCRLCRQLPDPCQGHRDRICAECRARRCGFVTLSGRAAVHRRTGLDERIADHGDWLAGGAGDVRLPAGAGKAARLRVGPALRLRGRATGVSGPCPKQCGGSRL